jgi:4-hydroxy-2-oxoheptanedioate aldolase
MEIRHNRFKRALAAGNRQIGLWLSLGGAASAEIIGPAGFDWLVLDTEHAPNELPDVVNQLRVLDAGHAEPVVRPAWNDMVIIKRLLDAGAQTLLVPFVQNADEARAAVSFMRYPPKGVRGVATGPRANRYGRVKDYVARVDDELCLLVQVETQAAVAEIAAIAAVDGVDGIFVGPSDLAADMGHVGNPAHPEVQAMLKAAAAACVAAGKPAGILAPVEADARRYIEWGYSFVAVGSDVGLLRGGADALAGKFAS